MKLTILGCSSATAIYDRHPSSQLLTIHDHHYLIDCGEGTLFRLNDFKIKKNKISAIFISHLHGDHYYGLIGLLTTMSMHERSDKLTIISPSRLKDILNLQFEISKSQIRFPIEFIEFDDLRSVEVYRDKNMIVSTIPLLHKITTCGFLFDKVYPSHKINKSKIDQYGLTNEEIKSILDGHSVARHDEEIDLSSIEDKTIYSKRFAYLSDTEYTETCLPYISNIDLLYHESTFIENDRVRAIQTKHSTTLDAAKIAKMAKVKKLIIGHFSARYTDLDPLLEEAKTVFKNSFLAEEGTCFEI